MMTIEVNECPDQNNLGFIVEEVNDILFGLSKKYPNNYMGEFMEGSNYYMSDIATKINCKVDRFGDEFTFDCQNKECTTITRSVG